MAINPQVTDASLTAGAIRRADLQRWWALPLALALVTAGVLALAIFGNDGDSARMAPQNGGESAEPLSPQPTGETVGLTIDFGNGARRTWDALPWRAGMTVADAMESARHFRPGVAFAQQGAGANAMLTAIEGFAGEGSGGRFWLYQVNDQFAHDSFAIHALAPGDRILWKFAAEGYNSGP